MVSDTATRISTDLLLSGNPYNNFDTNKKPFELVHKSNTLTKRFK